MQGQIIQTPSPLGYAACMSQKFLIRAFYAGVTYGKVKTKHYLLERRV